MNFPHSFNTLMFDGSNDLSWVSIVREDYEKLESKRDSKDLREESNKFHEKNDYSQDDGWGLDKESNNLTFKQGKKVMADRQSEYAKEIKKPDFKSFAIEVLAADRKDFIDDESLKNQKNRDQFEGMKKRSEPLPFSPLLLVHQLLTATDLTTKEINQLAFISGPGSFTGLRSFAITAKIMARLLGKKIYSMSIFDIWRFALWEISQYELDTMRMKPNEISPSTLARKKTIFHEKDVDRKGLLSSNASKGKEEKPNGSKHPSPNSGKLPLEVCQNGNQERMHATIESLASVLPVLDVWKCNHSYKPNQQTKNSNVDKNIFSKENPSSFLGRIKHEDKNVWMVRSFTSTYFVYHYCHVLTRQDLDTPLEGSANKGFATGKIENLLDIFFQQIKNFVGMEKSLASIKSQAKIIASPQPPKKQALEKKDGQVRRKGDAMEEKEQVTDERIDEVEGVIGKSFHASPNRFLVMCDSKMKYKFEEKLSEFFFFIGKESAAY